MKIKSSDLTQDVLTADVCVMGAGVAGITLANELKNQGKSVILLEAGGEEHDDTIQSRASASKVPSPYPDPSQTRLRRLGGTSNHWSNNTSPLSAIDFEKRDGMDNSGWPIALTDLEPHYKKAAVYCGTGDDGYDLDFWLKELKANPAFEAGESKGLSLSIAKAAVPPTRFFFKHGNALVTSSKVKVVTHAQVTDVNMIGENIESIIFVDNVGKSRRVDASQFVMAFGGIENARMLLHFNSKNQNKIGNQGGSVGRYFMDHPTFKGAQLYTNDTSPFSFFEGILASDYQRFIVSFMELTANRLREYELTNIRLPLTKATRQQMSHGISSFHMLKDRFRGKPISGSVLSHINNVLMDWDVVSDTISRKAFEQPLFEDVNQFAGYHVPLMMEQTPHRDNRITLSNDIDDYGIPKLSIDWKIHADDKARLWRGLDIFASEIGALGIGRIRVLRERASRLLEEQIGFGHHHMGTTRMSDTPADGVVDKNQLIFGTKNFYVAGCSVFATGGHVPPTLTIAATSIRLAEHLSQKS